MPLYPDIIVNISWSQRTTPWEIAQDVAVALIREWRGGAPLDIEVIKRFEKATRQHETTISEEAVLEIVQDMVFIDMGMFEFARLRRDLVNNAIDWERRFGVAPSITGSIAELDAALLVGASIDAYASGTKGISAVRKGFDFIQNGLRYQVKANRPSGRPGSRVTMTGKPKPSGWNRLIWIHYTPDYRILEAWECDRETWPYHGKKTIRPEHIRDIGSFFLVPQTHPGRFLNFRRPTSGKERENIRA